MARRKPTDGPKVACVNRRARHDYTIDATIEAGLSLTGGEVKALREGRGNLTDAFARIDRGRPVVLDFEIQPYSKDQTGHTVPRRPRALLLHRAEIRKLVMRLREPGNTLVPLRVYFKGPWAKIELGLAKGRRKQDKRQALREREHEREISRESRRRH